MSLGILDAHETPTGVHVTFITDCGLEPLEGTVEQIARLAEVMEQVSAIAPLNSGERVWIEDVVVGDCVVKLGLNPYGRVRMRIVRPKL
jgi:hypothetical protein